MLKNIIFFLFIITLATACKEDTPLAQPTDTLEDVGIFGTWEIQEESINGTMTTMPVCCEFFTFEADANLDDFSGNYSFEQNGTSNEGSFTMSIPNTTITLTNSSSEDLYEFTFLNADLLQLTSVGIGDLIVTTWARE